MMMMKVSSEYYRDPRYIGCVISSQSSRNLGRIVMAKSVHCAMAIWIEPTTTTTNHRGRESRECERVREGG